MLPNETQREAYQRVAMMAELIASEATSHESNEGVYHESNEGV